MSPILTALRFPSSKNFPFFVYIEVVLQVPPDLWPHDLNSLFTNVIRKSCAKDNHVGIQRRVILKSQARWSETNNRSVLDFNLQVVSPSPPALTAMSVTYQAISYFLRGANVDVVSALLSTENVPEIPERTVNPMRTSHNIEDTEPVPSARILRSMQSMPWRLRRSIMSHISYFGFNGEAMKTGELGPQSTTGGPPFTPSTPLDLC